MSPKIQSWGATGEALLIGATDSDLVSIAAVASKIQAMAAARLVPRPPPVLLDAHSAAALLGPSITAKWVYNHIRHMAPGVVRRIGGSIFFVGPKLLEWACDSTESVPRRVR